MRRAFSSTEITWVAAMATARMVLVFAFRVLEARGTASAVDPPALRCKSCPIPPVRPLL
jgi:hypothetical protein